MQLEIALNGSVEYIPPYNPVRGLLSAILERAVRDLGPNIEHQFRAGAIAWFRSKKRVSETSITFSLVCSGLELSDSQVKYLFELVNKAEALNDTQNKHSKKTAFRD